MEVDLRGDRSKSNETPKSPEPTSNTVKRNDGPVTPLDTTPTSEPLTEQPEKPDER